LITSHLSRVRKRGADNVVVNTYIGRQSWHIWW